MQNQPPPYAAGPPGPGNRRRRRGPALWTAGVLAVTGLLAVGGIWWNGTAYPSTDPDRVAEGLKAQAQVVYDDLALPGRPAVSATVATSTCPYRGLRGMFHTGTRPDVAGFWLHWKFDDMDPATARAGQDRVRARLERQGWRLVSENIASEQGFRYTAPNGKDKIDVNWYRPTRILAVTLHAPCGVLPEGFDKSDWPVANWTAR
ncbi:hypothetical protein AB0G74_26475 [Streptomyces sp. NPDC020875]|uniref:hypothetical protein n=1 Tax=Streptomyces sp. NPDC020875 TaxID=3154898 RepID=UPI0033CD3450